MFKFMAAAFVGVSAAIHGMFGIHSSASMEGTNHYVTPGTAPEQLRDIRMGDSGTQQVGKAYYGVVTSVATSSFAMNTRLGGTGITGATSSVSVLVNATTTKVVRVTPEETVASTTSMSGIAVGNKVVVRGFINGSTVTAKVVEIVIVPPPATGSSTKSRFELPVSTNPWWKL